MYYHACFADEKYIMLVISTYIYNGLHPEQGPIFFDINSETEVGFSEGKIHSVYDLNALIS